MKSMAHIHKDLGPNVCRNCINKKYKATLLPENCEYNYYPAECSSCGLKANIVTELHLIGKLKMLLK